MKRELLRKYLLLASTFHRQESCKSQPRRTTAVQLPRASQSTSSKEVPTKPHLSRKASRWQRTCPSGQRSSCFLKTHKSSASLQSSHLPCKSSTIVFQPQNLKIIFLHRKVKMGRLNFSGKEDYRKINVTFREHRQLQPLLKRWVLEWKLRVPWSVQALIMLQGRVQRLWILIWNCSIRDLRDHWSLASKVLE